MTGTEYDSTVPCIVELLDNISTLLDTTGLISVIAHIVIEYVRPHLSNPRSLMNGGYMKDLIVQFIVDDTFGISLNVLISHWHKRCTRDIGDRCTCTHQYLEIEWSTEIGEFLNFYNYGKIEFSDIWRYAVMDLDIVNIPISEILLDGDLYGHVPDGYDIICLAPGFKEIVRRVISDIWFGPPQ